MELDHDFTVPVPADRAWTVLLDVERVAACVPGATLDSVDGGEYAGRMKVKVGAMTITYRGTARIVSADEDARTVTLEAAAKEARGPGTASATVQARLHEEEDGTTRVTVHTKLNVTGRPAQFGRNILSEVGSKIIARFAKALAAELEAEPAEEGGPSVAPQTQAPSVESLPSEPKAGDKAGKGSGTEVAPTVEPKVEPTLEPAVEPAVEPAKAEVAEPVSEGPQSPAAPADESAARGNPPTAYARDDAIDLLEVAGPSLAKRAVPVLGALVALFLAIRFLARRRGRA
ncbi:SRPBCC domain-containing protein [Actinomadura roseirufa]|uniref:SRPBCC domain-containing protein n=1 Tax=Actinomadura roseirufa TaxID=2094049 RepID=UPI0010418D1D|nr:SRPBCC domain-containing protein [Actinomadura roseirufa]